VHILHQNVKRLQICLLKKKYIFPFSYVVPFGYDKSVNAGSVKF